MRHRLRILLLLAGLGVAGAGTAVAVDYWDPGPELRLSQALPPEATAIIEAAWLDFLAGVPRQVPCIADVDLVAVRTLPEGDAAYSYRERTIRVLIPTSPARFPETLTHEFAHHLEASCPVVDAIGPEFLAAQGLPPDRPWNGGPTWFETPSEQFAEAVVELIRGERITHHRDIEVSSEALAIVAEWAGAPDRRRAPLSQDSVDSPPAPDLHR